jgi:hypothetical protein
VLDLDLARVYGVATRVLNQAFQRNKRRFPKDFAFQLTAKESDSMRSQTVIASSDPAMRSQIVTATKRNIRYRPWAFTEHGALQAANILRSDRAIAMSVYVIRAFIELREKSAADAVILKRLAEIDKSLLLHDTALRDIYQKLLPLLSPPPEPPRRQIGFTAERSLKGTNAMAVFPGGAQTGARTLAASVHNWGNTSARTCARSPSTAWGALNS